MIQKPKHSRGDIVYVAECDSNRVPAPCLSCVDGYTRGRNNRQVLCGDCRGTGKSGRWKRFPKVAGPLRIMHITVERFTDTGPQYGYIFHDHFAPWTSIPESIVTATKSAAKAIAIAEVKADEEQWQERIKALS